MSSTTLTENRKRFRQMLLPPTGPDDKAHNYRLGGGLQEIVPGQMWTVQGIHFYRFLDGMSRMTLVRLRDGSLWVHSPIEIDDALYKQIHALGEVKYIVAPCNGHTLFVKKFQSYFPKAKLYVSPDVPRRRPDFEPFTVIDETGSKQPLPWTEEIDHVALQGHDWMDEVVFFHRASRTLLLADLLSTIDESDSIEFKTICRLGTTDIGRPGMLPVELIFFDPTNEDVQRSVGQMFAWDFDRIVLSHNHNVETGGKKAFQNAFFFLPLK